MGVGSLEPAEAESGRLGEDDATVAVGGAVGGTAVRWYRHLDNAGPAGADGMLLLLANEYWDAQPARFDEGILSLSLPYSRLYG